MRAACRPGRSCSAWAWILAISAAICRAMRSVSVWARAAIRRYRRDIRLQASRAIVRGARFSFLALPGVFRIWRILADRASKNGPAFLPIRYPSPPTEREVGPFQISRPSSPAS
jgi:hypothetical protein